MAAAISGASSKRFKAARQGDAEQVLVRSWWRAKKDATDKGGRTPLHWASSNGYIDMVRALLQAGANKEAADQRGRTPLHLASRNDHIEVVRALLEAGANKEAAEQDGRTPLHAASDKGHIEVLRALLEAGANKEAANKDGGTPLHCASSKGHIEVVWALLEAGANKEAAGQYGLTPLHQASDNGHIEVVRALLEAGANKEAAAQEGWTPLHAASDNGDIEVVRALLAAGANKEAASQDGWTPLHMASDKGHIEVVRALLEAGANKEAVDKDGRTPLHWASDNGHIEVVRALLEAGANKEAASQDGWTPLHAASDTGHIEVVRALLEAGANKEAVDKDVWTPLHLASRSGHIEVVRALLEAGANKEAVDQCWRTPLHLASRTGHIEVVRALLEAGANKEAADQAGRTALELARINQEMDVVELLKSYHSMAVQPASASTVQVLRPQRTPTQAVAPTPGLQHLRDEVASMHEDVVAVRDIQADLSHKVSQVLACMMKSSSGLPASQLPRTLIARSSLTIEQEALKDTQVGGFGTVVQALKDGSTKVALKKFNHRGLGKLDMKEIIREASLLHEANHPNIVRCFGVVWDLESSPQDSLHGSLVMEWVGSGNLYAWLQEQDEAPLRHRVQLAAQVAAGMRHLHVDVGVVHGDLKPQNVLVQLHVGEELPTIKICDFGLAKHLASSTQLASNGSRGTAYSPAYTSPERFRSRKRSKEDDVYAFGVLLYFIATSYTPFSEYVAEDLPPVVREGVRPDLDSWVLEAGGSSPVAKQVVLRYCQLAQRCWGGKPDSRPDFEQICQELGAMCMQMLPLV